MTDDRQAKCSERIGGQLSSRLDDFRKSAGDEAQAIENEDWQAADEINDEHFTAPLSVEVIRTLKVLLSTGGPADWFEAQIDSDGEPTRIEYHFADWFDHASVVLEGDDFDAAAQWLAPWFEGINEA